MSTGVAAVRHRSGLGLTFSRISHIKTKLFCRFSLYLFLLVLRNLSSNAQLCFFVVVFFSLTDTLVRSSTGHDRMPTLFTHL